MIEAIAISTLTACGLATIVTRPGLGPAYRLRRWVNKHHPGTRIEYFLGCRFCLSVWMGLASGIVGAVATRNPAVLTACPISPFVIHLIETYSAQLTAGTPPCPTCSGKSSEPPSPRSDAG